MDTCYCICTIDGQPFAYTESLGKTNMQVGFPTVMSTNYYKMCVANATRIPITDGASRFLNMMTFGR